MAAWRKFLGSMVVLAAGLLVPLARIAFRNGNQSHDEAGPIQCRMIGGPFAGRREEEWGDCRKIFLSLATNGHAPANVNRWAVYRRTDPDVISADGLIEFLFEGVKIEPLGGVAS